MPKKQPGFFDRLSGFAANTVSGVAKLTGSVATAAVTVVEVPVVAVIDTTITTLEEGNLIDGLASGLDTGVGVLGEGIKESVRLAGDALSDTVNGASHVVGSVNDPIPSKYRSIVGGAVVTAGGGGIPGAFSVAFDVGLMGSVWATMIYRIAEKSGHPINLALATKVASSLASSVGAYIAGSKLLTAGLHAIPGAGMLAAIGLNSGLNAVYTYKVGYSATLLFDDKNFNMMQFADVAFMVGSAVKGVPTHKDLLAVLSLLGESGKSV